MNTLMLTLALALAVPAQEPEAPRPRDPRVLTPADAISSFEHVFGPVQFIALDESARPGLVLERRGERGRASLRTSLVAVALDTGETLRALRALETEGPGWPGRAGRRRERWDARGDADGDGVADVIVGEWRSGREDGGRQGAVVAISVWSGEELHRSSGDDPLDGYGHSVAYLGDVDGDGHDDYAVGAPQAAVDEVVYSQGMVRSRTIGRPDGDSLLELEDGSKVRLSDFVRARLDARSEKLGYASVRSGADGSELARFVGEHAGHGFGTRVVALGDLDNDGVAELGIAPCAESDTAIRIVSMAKGAEVARIQNRGGPFGACGDFDGDGTPDLFQSPLDSESYEHVGKVEIVLGPAWEQRLALAAPDSSSPYTFARALGDLDGDGHAELAIGDANFGLFSPVPEWSDVKRPDLRQLTLDEVLAIESDPWVGEGVETGCVWVISGATRTVSFGMWAEPETRTGLGVYIEPTPDLDGDGRRDLLVTSLDRAYVFAGPRKASAATK